MNYINIKFIFSILLNIFNILKQLCHKTLLIDLPLNINIIYFYLVILYIERNKFVEQVHLIQNLFFSLQSVQRGSQSKTITFVPNTLDNHINILYGIQVGYLIMDPSGFWSKIKTLSENNLIIIVLIAFGSRFG